MKYNLKEQLFDKIGGLEFVNPDEYGAKYNRGVREAKARVGSFFNKELEPEVPQYVADWYESNKKNLDYNLWNYAYDWEDQEDDEFKNICLKVSLKDGGMRYFNHVRVSAGKLVEVNRIIDFYRILEKL